MASGNIAIIGGKGMLGTDIAQTFASQGFAVSVHDLPEFDMTDANSLRQVVQSSSIIINCAAYTDVEKAESQPDKARLINADCVGQLGELARQVGAYVLHFGTDFVFDGRFNHPYTEKDAPNPLSVYGKTKLLGEQYLQDSGCRYAIIRIEWTYGVHGTNFIKKIIAASQTRNELKIVDDQIGSPTATISIARILPEFLAQQPTGLYHFASSDYVSRFDMARFVFEKVSSNIKVLPCKSSDFKTAAVRPLNSRFDCTKIKSILKTPVDSWQGPLTHYLESSV